MTETIVLLGSNIDKKRSIHAAIAALDAHPEVTVLAQSSVYESEAVGPDGTPLDQEPYHNVAILLETVLCPEELQSLLRRLEASCGRVRTDDKYAARTIDLDIVLYGTEKVTLSDKPIPDDELFRFAYVAHPVAEIAPHWVVPDSGQTIRHIATKMVPTTLEIRKL